MASKKVDSKKLMHHCSTQIKGPFCGLIVAYVFPKMQDLAYNISKIVRPR